MPYLVAYDIADPRRLQRVARFLERRALRLQKSVFLFDGDRDAVSALLDQAAELIRPAEDVVQAWELARGTPSPVAPAGVVLGGRRPLFVRRGE